MTERLQTHRIEALFLEASELAPEARDEFLARLAHDDPNAAAEVRSLLGFDRPDDAFLRSPVLRPTNSDAPDPLTIPERIGRYRITRLIASGGMGAVYEAEQDHPNRTVALKLMKRGVASRSALRRFEHESQILARLNHPNISQVHDVGMFDDGLGGRPYFVMELIEDARSLTDFARAENLGTKERLELFTSVCDAVQHGHQKGIIHRDLKPGNILVDPSGQVKIIDFGVARATDSDIAVTTMQTDVGQLIGTLQYMSPEQVEADPHNLDTRSDGYSLGVVLYVLLCGKPPYDVSASPIYEAARTIRENTPARPSTVDRTLRGDLETIVLKSLEKDRERRYQSAADLAADIRRYLASEPIQARPASTAYQLRTFARRNKALVGGVGATIVVLMLGTIGTGIGLVSANKTAADLQAVADFQASLFSNVDVITLAGGLYDDIENRWRDSLERDGLTDEEVERELLLLERRADRVKVIEFVERMIDQSLFDEETLQYVNEGLAEQPVLQARLLHSIGGMRNRMGLRDRGVEPLERALEIRVAELGETHPDTITSLALVAQVRALCGYDGALSLSERAVEAARRHYGNEHERTRWARNKRGIVLNEYCLYEESLECFRENYDIRLRINGDASTTNIGHVLNNMERFAEAQIWLEECITNHMDGGGTPWRLGIALMEQGDLDEAETYLYEALDKRSESRGAHWRGAQVMLTISRLHLLKGEHEKAEAFARDALDFRRLQHWDQWKPPDIVDYLAQHAATLIARERFEDAEAELLESLAHFEDPGVPATRLRWEKKFDRLIETFNELYPAWTAAEPDSRIDERSAEVRARIEAARDKAAIAFSRSPD